MEKLKYLKDKKIMLLEDDKILLENYTNTFKSFFNQVFFADNYQDAYIQVKENKPDIIVVDVHLKNDKKDGLDFIKKLRDEDKNLPILVFSAMTDTEIFLKAIPLNLLDYFVKPISYNDIVTALIKYIDKSETNNIFIIDSKKNITFNSLTFELKKDEEVQKLPINARKLLALLIKSNENFVSYEMIENEIYFQKDFYITTVRNHISMLRAILGKDSIVVNVDQGYKLQL